MDDRELIETKLQESRFGAFHTADGQATSLGDLTRRVVMEAICPEIEGGYRWSAAANYLNACRRALTDSRPQPISRVGAKGQLTQTDRDRIWELASAVQAYWLALLAEAGVGPEASYLTRDQLRLTETGRRLFSLARAPRSRLSALAA